MCGIAGIANDPGVNPEVLGRMALSLAHRGPDDSGIWVDREAGVGLGHRRLAIVDLTAAGHQPMRSSTGRFVITFNGEIYNHQKLRADLIARGCSIEWRGHSDTETLLAAVETWGIKEALTRATGMFALALWDRTERTLTLARDRLGEKPLYYGRPAGVQGPFLFASELKALKQYPGFRPEVDRDSLALMLRYLAVPAPRSIYLGISKLPAGTMLTLAPDGAAEVVERYWSGAEVARWGAANPLELDARGATDRLEQILEGVVRRQLMGDVPIGAFLSGGVDSSTVVAIMQKLSRRPVRTFTIGFDVDGYDEATHARAVARHLGTDHTELYVTARQAMEVIPNLSSIYDEPFADSSQIPTCLVSTLAHRDVTVALSGDGGDELFGGYDRYRIINALWAKLSRVPLGLRSAAAATLRGISPAAWNRIGKICGPLLPSELRLTRFGDKIHRGVSLLQSKSLGELYDSIMSQWRDSNAVVIGATRAAEMVSMDGLRPVEGMMARDMLCYLPDDILVKLDRAAMAVSLETRVPLLDPEIVEFAWRLPLDLKLRDGTSKWVLREVLYRHVPRAIIERPKMGFGVPIDSWLRGPLRDWAEQLLEERQLRFDNYFNVNAVRQAWAGHVAGQPGHGLKIWTILMFQSWLNAERAESPAGNVDPGDLESILQPINGL